MRRRGDLASLVGRQFGRLTVKRVFRKDSRLMVGAECSCGRTCEKRLNNLERGFTKSCGCYQSESCRELGCRNKTHGLHRHPLYGRFSNMLRRLCDPKNDSYPDCGGRGIGVCDEWNPNVVGFGTAFKAYYDFAMSKGWSKGLSVERVDNDGDYEPGNCTLIPWLEQAKNRRSTVWMTAWGETKIMSDWARDPRCAVGVNTLHWRLNHGWSAELALTTPPDKGRKYTEVLEGLEHPN